MGFVDGHGVGVMRMKTSVTGWMRGGRKENAWMLARRQNCENWGDAKRWRTGQRLYSNLAAHSANH